MLLLDKLRQHNLTPAALIEMVIEHYTPRLQAIFPDDWPRRQQGLSELAHIASAYTDLEQFVADLSLETPEDEADEFDEAGRVVLSTIHSSKGLEWDAVILLDLVEDRFPSRHALVRPRRLRGGTPPHVRGLHPRPRGFGTVRARHALQPPERRQ